MALRKNVTLDPKHKHKIHNTNFKCNHCVCVYI